MATVHVHESLIITYAHEVRLLDTSKTLKRSDQELSVVEFILVIGTSVHDLYTHLHLIEPMGLA